MINDQFGGIDPWPSYIDALETAAPTISALGITDYYSTDTYKRVCEYKAIGRLPACNLIFPNVEMRLALGTVKGRWVNIHLVVNPEGPKHLEELARFLGRLSFEAHGDRYSCTRDDLMRLGRKIEPRATADRDAFARGAEQFKVSFDQLREADNFDWSRQNILIGVAGSEGDGISGLRDAADQVLRSEVERFAHFIFTGSRAQRDFWLGRGNVFSENDIEARYGSLKPCLHGSDAHSLGKVGAPDSDRFCWIKGAPEFDALQQACRDPAERAHVGPECPVHATDSQVISSIVIEDASWAQTPKLALNPGLVAIIGARGSGKTALADIIALGCNATSERLSEASFLERAGRDGLLSGSSIRLTWATGDENIRQLDRLDVSFAEDYPRARYLSQKFVEELCSAQGMTDALLREIERVVFENHPQSDRDGAADFNELLDLRATRHRRARQREEDSLTEISERIGTDLEKQRLVVGLEKQINEKTRLIKGYQGDQSKLIDKGTEAQANRITSLTAAAETVRGYLRYFSAREQSLLSLRDEVVNFRSTQAPENLRRTQERYRPADIDANHWAPFLLDYRGNVDDSVEIHLRLTHEGMNNWRGIKPPVIGSVDVPFITENADISKQSLANIEAEIARLEKIVSIGRDTSNRFGALNKRISEETMLLTHLTNQMKDCKGAPARVAELVSEREITYARVFDAVLAEEHVLTELYRPLMDRLRGTNGTLGKLTFNVTRTADVDAWAKAGEALFDLRQTGPARGKGSLASRAMESLKGAWETGDSSAVAAAMAQFRADHQSALLEHSHVARSNQPDYRAWTKRFAKWLYSTAHIRVEYGIDYDNTDIRKLSPGTRGIVLLLLYLALDDNDDRPLIIDQPEENLDPKSVFQELIGLFIAAKKKRQVIVVTHNANLVVNTDADQIIIAESGPHKPGELPPITYVSGGLESSTIRGAVCDILEGGERAFQERAKRLRITLSR